MLTRCDILKGGIKLRSDDFRGAPVPGSFVRLADGTELLVERVIYPVGARLVLECVDYPKKAPIVEPAKVVETKPEPSVVNEKVDTTRKASNNKR